MAASSSLTISPIWVSLMNEIHSQKKWQSREFDKPDGLKRVTLDLETGKKPTTATRRRTTDIFASNYEAPKSGKSVTYTIDKISGKLATECTPASTREVVKGEGLDAEIPKSDPNYNSWATPIKAYAAKIHRAFGAGKPTEEDDVHKCSDSKPDIASISVAPSGGSYRITASVSKGTHPLDNITFAVGGKSVGSSSITGSGTYSKTASMSPGPHTIRVIVKDKAGYETEGSITYNADSSSGIISNVTAQKVASNRVRVTWSSTFPSGTTYTICYSGPGGSDCQTKTSSPKVFNPFNNAPGIYNFTVSAGSQTASDTLLWN